MSNILIIAPHADDEILGCGGSISYFIKKNFKVYVAIMTNANKGNPKLYSSNLINKIRKESLNAHKFLKISHTYFFDFPAPQLDQYPISLISDAINDLVKKINPKIVFLPHIGDSHIDHQIIHKASLVALRPINKNNLIKILSYETLSETEWGVNSSNNLFIPNYFISLKSEDIRKKILAFEKYKSQIKKHPHPRSLKGIENLARFRGNNISEKNAEAFMLIRNIIK